MDALIPNQVPEARFSLAYQQRDITHDISEYLIGLSYTDHLTGRSDDLQVDLHDIDGKWLDAWYPGHGDTLELSIGWFGRPVRALGRFEIDDVGNAGPPSVATISALGAGINLPIRTAEHRAYESTTLADIARQVAGRLGLTLTGKIASIKIDRETQQESDLAFLNKLAGEYDYAFKVTGTRLVFHSISDLAAMPPVTTLSLKDLEDYRFRDQIRQVPKAVQVKHRDPAKKQLMTYRLDNNGETVAVPSSSSKATSSADTTKQRKRSTSPEVAAARAAAEQARTNRERTTAQLTLLGRPNLLSGNVVTLTGAGKLSGRYLIMSARHRFSRRGGYQVELDACRVAAEVIGFELPAAIAMNTYGMQAEGSLA